MRVELHGEDYTVAKLDWHARAERPLAGDVRRITCSFIAHSCMSIVCMLKLQVQFCMQREGFEECTQNLTFHVGGAKVFLWLSPLQEVHITKCGRI